MTIPEPSGLIDGKLRPCPNSPNCVCSEFTEVEHAIEPLVISSDPIEAWSRLLDILNELPRTTIVRQTDHYLQAVVRTRILRFEDVLEFRLDPAASRIQVRSASKVGYSDLGTNRRRVETIRKRFARE